MPVADVQHAFPTTNFDTLVTLPGFGEVSVNVARIVDRPGYVASSPMGPERAWSI
jgi:hypothetical protein